MTLPEFFDFLHSQSDDWNKCDGAVWLNFKGYIIRLEPDGALDDPRIICRISTPMPHPTTLVYFCNGKEIDALYGRVIRVAKEIAIEQVLDIIRCKMLGEPA